MFSVPVVELGACEPLPNSDRLSLTEVEGKPCIFNREVDGLYEGAVAVYVPIDSLVPVTHPAFAFLRRSPGRDYERVRAVRLRGTFSMGLLVPLSRFEGLAAEVGDDVAEKLGIHKYEEPEPLDMSSEKDPGFMPVYHLEDFREFGAQVFPPGMRVSITEKVHGMNFRVAHHEGRFWVGSHDRVKKLDGSNPWVHEARRLNLEEKLKAHPGIVLYGEVYGTQDLRYGLPPTCLDTRFFDAYDIAKKEYLSVMELDVLLGTLGLPKVPEVYSGPVLTRAELEAMARGNSLLYPGHVMEGVVVRGLTSSAHRVAKKRRDETVYRIVRNVLKLVGQDYMLRKGGTERH